MSAILDAIETVSRRDEIVAECNEKLRQLQGWWLTPEERRIRAETISCIESARRGGRVIHLQSLISARREDGFPVWAVVNPYFPISYHKDNGTVYFDAHQPVIRSQSFDLIWRNNRRGHEGFSSLAGRPTRGGGARQWSLPGGFPILPERVRNLLRRRDVRRAYCAAIVYQPQSWTTVARVAPPHPDPALIVKWNSSDSDSDWRALAVWGHDGPRIEEFLE